MPTTPDPHETLESWLDRVNAREQWAVKVSGVGQLTAYRVNGFVILVMRYRYGHGWELYTPAEKTNRIADALSAADHFCEVNVTTGD